MGLVRPPFTAGPRAALVAVALIAAGCASPPNETNDVPLCERCHGGNGSAAPPRSTHGATETTDRGVGAHARHLALQGDDVAAALPCETCHVVPATVDEHVDGVVRVQLPAFAAVPGKPAPAWNAETGRCENVSCHGAVFAPGQAGDATAPSWAGVAGSQMGCGSCHAAPPASHAAYAGRDQCHVCHPGTVKADGTINLASGLHMDGSTPPPGASCDGCHLAPPDTGAHRAHSNVASASTLSYGSLAVEVGVAPDGAPAYVFGCGYCHPLEEAAHLAHLGPVDVPDVVLAPAGSGSLKALDAPAAAWDPASGVCSGVYCHGATLRDGSGGAATSPAWTQTTAPTCSSCHAERPASHDWYETPDDCGRCHGPTGLAEGGTLQADGTIDLASRKHLDGATLAPTQCDACHLAPPATGAHLVHANPADPAAIAYGSLDTLEDRQPTGGPKYDFGCGQCHPVEEGRHRDGLLQVDLAPPATPVTGDDVKSRNDASAAWATDGTCSGVYCHSSGQETPTFVASPAWNAAPGALGCGGCHGNPPSYATGGAGTTTANSHLALTSGWEWGHFAGMPGPYSHGSNHGGGNPNFPSAQASPITCQACHAETVDPSWVMSEGRFYWLDTSGTYALTGGDPNRLADESWFHVQCGHCHGDGGAPVAAGKVLPLRHVNGKRDVAFDGRRTLPSGYPGLPAVVGADPDPAIEFRPYYVTGFALPTTEAIPPDAALRPTGTDTAAYTTTLESATYDPVTKTCSSIGCHISRQALVEAGKAGPLRWGAPYDSTVACTGCHK